MTIELPPSYLGITGFMSSAETAAIRESFLEDPIMFGVLASTSPTIYRTARGRARYPEAETIASIFPEKSDRTLNLIHLHAPDDWSLGFYLRALAREVGDALQGFQLNIPWPDPGILKAYRESETGRDHVLALQVGPAAIEAAGGNGTMIANLLSQYVGAIDYVCIDASAGAGKELDPRFMTDCLFAMEERELPFGRVVAGGLRAENLDRLLGPLLPRFRDFGTDAEGGVRDEQGRLDIDRARALLRAIKALRAQFAA